MEAKSLLQGSSLKPSYPLPKLSKTTMMTANCVRFSFNYNNPCLLFANGYPSSSSLPLSLQNKPRKSASVVVSARRKDKKEDTHSSVPKPDEVTGFFPEAVLLKKVTFLYIPAFCFCRFPLSLMWFSRLEQFFMGLVLRARYPFEGSFILSLGFS